MILFSTLVHYSCTHKFHIQREEVLLVYLPFKQQKNLMIILNLVTAIRSASVLSSWQLMANISTTLISMWNSDFECVGVAAVDPARSSVWLHAGRLPCGGCVGVGNPLDTGVQEVASNAGNEAESRQTSPNPKIYSLHFFRR